VHGCNVKRLWRYKCMEKPRRRGSVVVRHHFKPQRQQLLDLHSCDITTPTQSLAAQSTNGIRGGSCCKKKIKQRDQYHIIAYERFLTWSKKGKWSLKCVDGLRLNVGSWPAGHKLITELKRFDTWVLECVLYSLIGSILPSIRSYDVEHWRHWEENDHS
jgi:hypothetical protein